jgi:hypothetical protein
VLTFLKTAAVVLCLFALVPLCVWGGSGSLRQAWEAAKTFGLIMGGLAVAGGGTALLMVLAQRL